MKRFDGERASAGRRPFCQRRTVRCADVSDAQLLATHLASLPQLRVGEFALIKATVDFADEQGNGRRAVSRAQEAQERPTCKRRRWPSMTIAMCASPAECR